ncbi:response regulator [Horticoccus luteus]|uniref:Response regulator n=1 Tax=Horticoccus luteus TaxID=2862869 RepID=A0A8F9TUK9_9BACT|nr:response regulator [Horticoccus luteus]QYM78372.1 response regulator [Horticoccus luteus]
MSKPKNILLAEDSPLDVEMTVTALSDHNLANTIVVVRDGAEALDYLYRRGAFAARTDGDPALVLLDIKMPRVDGLEVLRQIKGDDSLRTIPVVMLTSSREESDLARSYRLGINAYVVKPVDFPAFMDALKQVGVFWTVHNELPPSSTAPAPVLS